jgi:hypothetical protein
MVPKTPVMYRVAHDLEFHRCSSNGFAAATGFFAAANGMRMNGEKFGIRYDIRDRS